MQAPEKLRLAVLGVGEHARRNILPAIRGCERVALHGLFDLDEKVKLDAAEQYGARAYPSADELFADDEVDAVYIAVPTGLHAELGERALEAGRHLWCEKSFCANWDDWQRLVDLARSKRLAAFECLMFPHHAQFRRILQHLADRTIGAVRSVTARFGFPHLKPENFRYHKRLGGGAVLDAGAYPLCAARILLGKVETVDALIETEPGYEVDTAGSALLGAPSGAHAHLEWGFGRAYRNEIEIWGQQGTLYAGRVFSKPPTLETTLHFQMQNGEERDETVEPCNHFTVMLDAFAEAVQAGEVETFTQATWDQGELLSRVAAHNSK